MCGTRNLDLRPFSTEEKVGKVKERFGSMINDDMMSVHLTPPTPESRSLFQVVCGQDKLISKLAEREPQEHGVSQTQSEGPGRQRSTFPWNLGSLSKVRLILCQGGSKSKSSSIGPDRPPAPSSLTSPQGCARKGEEKPTRKREKNRCSSSLQLLLRDPALPLLVL